MYTLWEDISYLSIGNKRQIAAFRILTELRVLEILEEFNPILVGTIPIEIDIPGSDLDIICEAYDTDSFMNRVTYNFGHHETYHIQKKNIKGFLSVVCNFSYGNTPIQIFAQPKPVKEQNAYRHMIIEARLLSIGGKTSKLEIQNLKKRGFKTEPAFAKYFCLPGDPYESLLDLANISDEMLKQKLQNFSPRTNK